MHLLNVNNVLTSFWNGANKRKKRMNFFPDRQQHTKNDRKRPNQKKSFHINAKCKEATHSAKQLTKKIVKIPKKEKNSFLTFTEKAIVLCVSACNREVQAGGRFRSGKSFVYFFKYSVPLCVDLSSYLESVVRGGGGGGDLELLIVVAWVKFSSHPAPSISIYLLCTTKVHE